MVRNTLLLIALVFIGSVYAKTPPKAPTDSRWVQDYANILTERQEIYLLEKLKAYYDSTSTEMVIVTENSLEGDDAFDYSYRLAQSWGIGQQGKNNGLLIYIAMQERAIRIQVAPGLEGAIPDIYAKRVIEEQIKPKFKEERYGEGLNNAIDVLIQMAAGEYKSDGQSGPPGFPIWLVILIIVILIIIISKNGNNDSKTYRNTGRGFQGPIFMPRGGGGFGGGGFGGGGFGGGFGGGSFGGGGAGGSW